MIYLWWLFLALASRLQLESAMDLPSPFYFSWPFASFIEHHVHFAHIGVLLSILDTNLFPLCGISFFWPFGRLYKLHLNLMFSSCLLRHGFYLISDIYLPSPDFGYFSHSAALHHIFDGNIMFSFANVGFSFPALGHLAAWLLFMPFGIVSIGSFAYLWPFGCISPHPPLNIMFSLPTLAFSQSWDLWLYSHSFCHLAIIIGHLAHLPV